MEDIEDMFKDGDDQIEARPAPTKRKIMRKAKVAQKQKEEAEKQEEEQARAGDAANGGCGGVQSECQKTECEKGGGCGGQTSALDKVDGQTAAPGTQSIYVKTYGCSHNISDGEYMAGLLADYGYTIVDDMATSDACLINSCTVKNPS